MPLVDPVQRSAWTLVERALETIDDALHPVEAPLDTVPARGDQIDQQSEIFDTGTALRVQVTLESLEPPDCLAREAANLRDVPPDGENLCPQALLHGFTDTVGHGGLEFGRTGSKVVECFARTCEGGLESGRFRMARTRFREARPGPFERLPIHAGDCSVGVGLNDDGGVAWHADGGARL